MPLVHLHADVRQCLAMQGRGHYKSLIGVVHERHREDRSMRCAPCVVLCTWYAANCTQINCLPDMTLPVTAGCRHTFPSSIPQISPAGQRLPPSQCIRSTFLSCCAHPTFQAFVNTRSWYEHATSIPTCACPARVRPLVCFRHMHQQRNNIASVRDSAIAGDRSAEPCS